MTYSCGVWPAADSTLETAQASKYELVCRKLGLEPGMRLLDVGCGWGGMVMHAAQHHGVRAVGVTLSQRQAEWARHAVREAGLEDRVEIRVQDYRDVRDGPFDAISSIGMFEHVGAAKLDEYFATLFALRAARAAGCSTTASRARRRAAARGRASRAAASSTATCSPTASCTRSAASCRASRRAGFEARHVESLREHYALTLRAWVRNLEASWDRRGRRGRRRHARACGGSTWRRRAVNFEDGRHADPPGARSARRRRRERFRVAPAVGSSTRRCADISGHADTSATARDNHEPRRRSDGARVRGSSGGRSFSVWIVPPIATRVREPCTSDHANRAAGRDHHSACFSRAEHGPREWPAMRTHLPRSRRLSRRDPATARCCATRGSPRRTSDRGSRSRATTGSTRVAIWRARLPLHLAPAPRSLRSRVARAQREQAGTRLAAGVRHRPPRAGAAQRSASTTSSAPGTANASTSTGSA